jgi:sugar transferase (PEP-CTERM/EpsH1 system associated)
MRILWLKSDLLVPLDKGGKLRTWHLMRHLARQHDITYLGFASPDDPSDAPERMREVARRVISVPRSDPPKRSAWFYVDAARYLLNPLPYAIAKYRSGAYRREIERLLSEDAFDVIVSDFVLPMVNLPANVPCPVVVFTHNVEAEIWRRHAETQTSAVGRFLYDTQYRRMQRFERRALGRAGGVLAVSDVDRVTLARTYPDVMREPARVIPTGVDTGFFEPASSAAHSRSLVFTGSMDWLPNEDAMTYFCREVLPLVRAEEPATTLTIVGRAPTPRVARLAEQPGISVTGRVEDVRPHIGAAAVYVVPLRIGGGTRLKIFEAMAMGKAVVSTSIGAEGLPVKHEQQLLIADDPREFAGAVLRLFRDAELRRAIEQAARALVVARYDWAVCASELEQALAHFARGGDATSRIPSGPVPQSPLPASTLAD